MFFGFLNETLAEVVRFLRTFHGGFQHLRGVYTQSECKGTKKIRYVQVFVSFLQYFCRSGVKYVCFTLYEQRANNAVITRLSRANHALFDAVNTKQYENFVKADKTEAPVSRRVHSSLQIQQTSAVFLAVEV